MPGLSSTKKAQVVPMNPDSNDAQSQNNVANPEVQPIGFFEALLVLARGDYMLLSEKQKTTGEKENLTNNYVNVGVMSALLLGQVNVNSDGLGDKIVEAGGMSQDACDSVMVCLNTLAFLLFFFGDVAIAGLLHSCKRVHGRRGRILGSGHGQPPQLTLQTLFLWLGYILGWKDLGFVLDCVSRGRNPESGRMRSHLPGCHLRADQVCASSLPSEARFLGRATG